MKQMIDKVTGKVLTRSEAEARIKDKAGLVIVIMALFLAGIHTLQMALVEQHKLNCYKQPIHMASSKQRVSNKVSLKVSKKMQNYVVINSV